MLNWGRTVPSAHPLRTRFPHRYMDHVIPDGDIPGLAGVLLEFHDRIFELQTPLPPDHRGRARGARVVLRPDDRGRRHPHPGHSVPPDGRCPGRRIGPRVGRRARRHQPDHRAAPRHEPRTAGSGRRPLRRGAAVDRRHPPGRARDHQHRHHARTVDQRGHTDRCPPRGRGLRTRRTSATRSSSSVIRRRGRSWRRSHRVSTNAAPNGSLRSRRATSSTRCSTTSTSSRAPGPTRAEPTEPTEPYLNAAATGRAIAAALEGVSS